MRAIIRKQHDMPHRPHTIKNKWLIEEMKDKGILPLRKREKEVKVFEAKISVYEANDEAWIPEVWYTSGNGGSFELRMLSRETPEEAINAAAEELKACLRDAIIIREEMKND